MSAEIGDATVGSLASGTSKDSSLDAPGYFSALVASLTYVNELGEARPEHALSRSEPYQCAVRLACVVLNSSSLSQHLPR